jgi:hypothetical protein
MRVARTLFAIAGQPKNKRHRAHEDKDQEIKGCLAILKGGFLAAMK